jgi:hypothetical protein
MGTPSRPAGLPAYPRYALKSAIRLLFFPDKNLECLEPYNATQDPKKSLDRGTPDNYTITSLYMIFQFWKIVEVIIRTCQTPQGENRGFGARPGAR